MTYDYAPIAQSLARWLRSRPGVSDVQGPVLQPKVPSPRPRLPVPSFLLPKQQPSFEIRFTFKGEPRLFRYYVETVDDPETVGATLRVHTNGELMVRVPDEYGHVMANAIHYSNRSMSGAEFGGPAPRA